MISTNLILLAALAGPGLTNDLQQLRPASTPVAQSDAKLPAPPVVATPERGRAAAPAGAVSSTLAKPIGAAGTRVTAPAIDRLYYASEPDGSTWVRGRTYKARFGTGGATYVPFLGSDAPRNFPLELSLDAATVNGHALALAPATSAVRDGDTVVVERGPIAEVYELSLDSVEQTFVVRERPAAGDLVLFVRLDSEMQRGETADGFTFSNEHGAVRYGRAFVREADGDRVPVQSRAVAGGVEIAVGRDYLATAQFPLVVDPVISTFDVDTFGVDQVESDVAYDKTTDRYLIVYEEVFSATDSDVRAQIRLGDATFWGADFLDVTSESWRSPQVANNNLANQFLCVAQCNNVIGSNGFVVRGVTVDAATLNQGFKFNISSTDQTGDKMIPEVGGDPYEIGGSVYYCVVWQRNFTPTDTDIHARLVTPQGTLQGTGTLLIDNSGSTLDGWPSIAKSNGTVAWTIAWHRPVGDGTWDIHAARLGWEGNVLFPSTPIDTSVGSDVFPRVSSPLGDGKTLVVYAHDYGTDHDLEYSLLQDLTVVGSGSLTSLDSTGFVFQDQVEYSVDSDGERFVVVYAENYDTSTFDYDIWLSTFGLVDGALTVTDARQSLDFSTQQSLRSDVVANRSGGVFSPRFFATWDTTPSTSHDIRGAIYDRPIGGGWVAECFGDGSGTACPCGNTGLGGRGCANSQNAFGALLSPSGNAQTGAGDTLQFEVDGTPANVTCTLFQGSALDGASVFGDGLRCAGGTVVRIRTKTASPAGTATWPTGAEADISVAGLVPVTGAVRHYQVLYRNAASFCTSATFNTSNGLQVVWLP